MQLRCCYNCNSTITYIENHVYPNVASVQFLCDIHTIEMTSLCGPVFCSARIVYFFASKRAPFHLCQELWQSKTLPGDNHSLTPSVRSITFLEMFHSYLVYLLYMRCSTLAILSVVSSVHKSTEYPRHPQHRGRTSSRQQTQIEGSWTDRSSRQQTHRQSYLYLWPWHRQIHRYSRPHPAC